MTNATIEAPKFQRDDPHHTPDSVDLSHPVTINEDLIDAPLGILVKNNPGMFNSETVAKFANMSDDEIISQDASEREKATPQFEGFDEWVAAQPEIIRPDVQIRVLGKVIVDNSVYQPEE